jgi:carbon monoxide dehydrogenase subunit G
MNKIENQIFINRPPQEVFEYVTDPANSLKYQSGTSMAEWISEGPVGVGSTWKAVTRFVGRDIEGELQITEWQPPNLNSFKTISGPVPFEMTIKTEPQGEGTLLTQIGQADFGGIFKLAEGMVGKQLKKHMEADNQTLKELLENNSQ